VLIPRGSANLINIVLQEATVPVIETGAGNCHVYIDESANEEVSMDIVKNAKLQRPSVCIAIETILVHHESYKGFGDNLLIHFYVHLQVSVCMRTNTRVLIQTRL